MDSIIDLNHSICETNHKPANVIQRPSVTFTYNESVEEYSASLKHVLSTEYSQLSPGFFSAKSSVVTLNGVTLVCRSAEAKYVCLGSSFDKITFAFPATDEPFFANSILYDGSKQKVYMPGGEVKTIIPANLEQLFIVIDISELNSYLSEQQISLFMKTAEKMERMQVCRQYKKASIHFMYSLYRNICSGFHLKSKNTADELVSSGCYPGMIVRFLYEYVLYHAEYLETPLSSHGRVVYRGMAYIDKNPEQFINLDSLSKNIFASRRTIQYAFSAITGLTPIQYIKVRKLNHVRRKLLGTSTGDSNVSNILHKCNIKNHGRFSSEYRTLFTEMPSETLVRGTAI